MNKAQISMWDITSQLNNDQTNVWTSSQSNTRQDSHISTNNAWSNDTDYTEEIKQRNIKKYCPWPDWCCTCIQGFLLGSLLVGLVLAIIIAFLLTSKTITTTSTIQTTNLSGSSSSTATASTVSMSSSSTTAPTVSTSTTTATPTCATWLWNTTGVTVAGTTGSSGSAQNHLHSPWNIYVDPTNNYLYIADSQNHRIQLWLPGASTGATVAGTGAQGSGPNQLSLPKDVFVDSSQNIYVADSGNDRIQFFLNGSMTGITLSSSWSGLGELWGVQVVAGSIYACDKTQSTVWKNGSVVAGNNGQGPNSNQLNLPQGFTVDTSPVSIGTVYVANSAQHTIVQWPVGASTGNVVAGVNGNSGSTSTLLNVPLAIKLDSYTNMFVVDNNNHRIQLFCRYPTINTTARTIAGTGVQGSTPTTLNFPAGVALDASLNLYVSDTSNNRVQKFQRLQ